MEKVQLTTKYPIISGIYRFVYPNGKSYIGQAGNIYSRIIEHNNYAKYGRGQHPLLKCEEEMQKQKYLISEFWILEEIKDPSKLDERESYWIDFFHSYIQDGQGYNMTRGGNASNQKGVESTNAKFTQETLNELIDLLQNHRELSLNDLAIKFNVHLETIRNINNGETYTSSSLHYPIRSNPSQRRLKYLDDYFESEEKLLQLKEDLMYRWDLTIDKDLTKKYNLPIDLLRDINNGRRFAEIGNYSYPIRKPNQISHKNPLTREEILEILHLLKDTTVPITKIAEKFKVSRNTIYNINNGTTYLIKDFFYPARKTHKR